MSACNRPVCAYTLTFYVGEINYEIEVECPHLATHVVLERHAEGAEWIHARDVIGGLQYACDLHARTRVEGRLDPNGRLRVAPMVLAGFEADRLRFLEAEAARAMGLVR